MEQKDKLTQQDEYNVRDRLSVQLHEYIFKKFGLDWNTLDTDISNKISEICDSVIDNMHRELNDEVEEYLKNENK